MDAITITLKLYITGVLSLSWWRWAWGTFDIKDQCYPCWWTWAWGAYDINEHGREVRTTLRINATPVDAHEREVRTTLHPVLHALEHYITSCLAGIGALHYHYIITTFCLAGIGALHWSTALHPALHYILSYRHWSWICAWRVEHGNLRRDPPGRQAGKGFTAYVVSHVSFLTHVCLQGPERIPIKLLLHHMLIVIALPASLCF
jgi:hypothetical protein